MKNFIALPYALIVYFLGLKASYEILMQIFDTPQEWQILIVAIMGIFSAGAVKILIEDRYESPIFSKMSLLLLGIIFAVIAVFAYARNLGVTNFGFYYDISFAILAVTALYFGKN